MQSVSMCGDNTRRSMQSPITSDYKQRFALSLPSGKLDLYVAAAGFQASQTLPCVLDMGTNNMDLRKDPTYMGLDQDRLDGDKFYEVQPSTHTLTHCSLPAVRNAVCKFNASFGLRPVVIAPGCRLRRLPL